MCLSRSAASGLWQMTNRSVSLAAAQVAAVAVRGPAARVGGAATAPAVLSLSGAVSR
jgi:hypothetical protein